MKRFVIAAFCLATLGHAHAQGPGVSAADTIQSVVAAHKGKRLTLRLRSGQEISGTVRETSDRLVVLGEVSGREYFDAVIPIEGIEAILIRTRQ